MEQKHLLQALTPICFLKLQLAKEFLEGDDKFDQTLLTKHLARHTCPRAYNSAAYDPTDTKTMLGTSTLMSWCRYQTSLESVKNHEQRKLFTLTNQPMVTQTDCFELICNDKPMTQTNWWYLNDDIKPVKLTVAETVLIFRTTYINGKHYEDRKDESLPRANKSWHTNKFYVTHTYRGFSRFVLHLGFCWCDG